MDNNILFLNNYINDIEYDFLKNGNTKYTYVCKKFYGVDIEKISIYIWTLNIMDEFSQTINEKCKDIDNIEKISKDVYDLIKTDRKKVILYSYLKGHLLGYNNYVLIKEFKSINKDIIEQDLAELLSKSEPDEYLEIKKFQGDIKLKDIYINDENKLIENIKKFYLNSMEEKIKDLNLKVDVEKIINSVNEIMINDAKNKYNEAILDGIIQKINKKSLKINKITL
ncbi:MAG: hypothetical protein ACRDDE_02460 [Paraclostridium sp.]|uniref:hypothetical protein n=1 Tax=Paraclostridium sp. TaxID=2023273 RepID=UPI003EE7DA28